MLKSVDKGTYGPGKQIDTGKPFTARMDFGHSQGYSLHLTQNGQTLSLESNCGDYYNALAADLEAGMTFAISNWGGPGIDMSWLDGKTGCTEACDNNPSFYISDIKITTGSKIMPADPETISNSTSIIQ